MKISSIRAERGSAVIDFVLYGVMLQIGLLLFGLQVFEQQANQLAAESMARHSLRSFALTGTEVQETAVQVLNDFGTATPTSENLRVQLLCEPDCDSEGSVLTVNVKFKRAVASSTLVR